MSFEVVNDKLLINGKPVAWVSANSFGGRFHPTLIICHDTADRPAPKDTVNYFASRDCKVSAHLVVERNGDVTQMVPFDHKAWHAGASCWEGQNGVNNFAIGIEIDNPGALSKDGKAWFTGKNEAPITGIQFAETKEHGRAWWLGYTPEQIATVTQICQALAAAYPTIKAIGTHWIISPGRKVDTNPLFPLDELREAVFPKSKAPIGRPLAFPELKLGDTGDKVKAAQDKLAALGYQVGACDGQFGPQMRTAVLALEAENDWPYDATLAPNEHKLLMTDPATKAMPVGARAEDTAKDLRDKGSMIVTYAMRGKKLVGSGLSLLGLGGIDQVANNGDGLKQGVAQLGEVKSMAIDAAPILNIPVHAAVVAFVGLGLTGVALYFLFDWIVASRVKDHQTGANMTR